MIKTSKRRILQQSEYSSIYLTFEEVLILHQHRPYFALDLFHTSALDYGEGKKNFFFPPLNSYETELLFFF
jgi:hypothetical protein